MTHHYLIFNQELRLWNVLHSESHIEVEEVEMYQRLGACDIIDITDPSDPKSLIGCTKN